MLERRVEGQKMRAFVALELPRSVIRRISEIRGALATPDAKVRWVEPEKMHLTLKFLGDVDAQQLEAMAESVRQASERFDALKLGVGGLGAFPNRRNPRIIWVGISGHNGLLELYRHFEEAAVAVGVEPDERPFSPHLTLGRVKFVERHSPLLQRLKSIRVETLFASVTRVTLFQSTLTPEGPVYTPVERVQLHSHES